MEMNKKIVPILFMKKNEGNGTLTYLRLWNRPLFKSMSYEGFRSGVVQCAGWVPYASEIAL